MRKELKAGFSPSEKICPGKPKNTMWLLLISEDRIDLSSYVRILEGLI